MSELPCALEVSDFAGEHEAGTRGQIVDHPARVEERGGDLRSSMSQGDAQILTLLLLLRLLVVQRPHVTGLGFGDDVDECDVFAFLEFLALTEHGHPVAVLARVMPQQIVDRADAEVFLERTGGLLAKDVVKPVGQHGHDYSTPISNASPRWS